ncbi:hypothetical protein CGC21_26775 [Leishmania donovani]|uniref:Uncharacterized protein n=1 Tax=Leishmania donovani TaxID=5661 RepID=A0A504WUA8_LEIDO|nr:hypothetical protein CGC21_26775 [Leishmania donovani]
MNSPYPRPLSRAPGGESVAGLHPSLNPGSSELFQEHTREKAAHRRRRGHRIKGGFRVRQFPRPEQSTSGLTTWGSFLGGCCYLQSTGTQRGFGKEPGHPAPFGAAQPTAAAPHTAQARPGTTLESAGANLIIMTASHFATAPAQPFPT